MKNERTFPTTGKKWNDVWAEMQQLKSVDLPWHSGRAYMSAFHADDELYEHVKAAYAEFLSENALFSGGKFKSLKKFEDDIVSMTGDILGAVPGVDGIVTTGGTESILIAVKCALQHAKSENSALQAPEVVLPWSAHPAFDKACSLMGIKTKRIPLGQDWRADIAAMRVAITQNTIMMVGSAPCWPLGLIDPIETLASIAAERRVWFHTDACVGGYVVPFVRKAGFEAPAFDFSIPGVQSISADLHKYGYAAKNISTVMFRNSRLKELARFSFDQWNGGDYETYTYVGSRTGGAIAAAWAVMNILGEQGYVSLARKSMEVVAGIKRGVETIDDLFVVGEPKAVLIAISSDTVNMLQVAKGLEARGYFPNTIDVPQGLVFLANPLHLPQVEGLVAALRDAVLEAKKAPAVEGLKAKYN